MMAVLVATQTFFTDYEAKLKEAKTNIGQEQRGCGGTSDFAHRHHNYI